MEGATSGGILDVVDTETGEVLFSVAVPHGIVAARPYFELLEAGQHLEIAEGLVARQPRGSALLIRSEVETDSGANPDFQPSSADRERRKLELMVRQLAASTVEKTVAARMAALETIERVPSAPPAAQAENEQDGEAPLVE